MKKRGFTIFFAVLVGSLSLAIGLAIYDLLIRELELSQVATQSQYAIYAADTGVECALYWDGKCSLASCVQGIAFATSTEFQGATPGAGVFCNGFDISADGTPPSPYAPPSAAWTNWSVTPDGTNGATTVFWVGLTNVLTGPCVQVTVTKENSPETTTIVSRGYNSCSDTGPVRVERALEVTY